MKKNKILVTFLIIFVVISFLLGSYIIYKEYFKDNKCDDPKSEIKENTNYVVDLVNVKKEPKYVGTCNPDPKKGNIDIKLPKINIDTANAKKLNNLNQTDYKKEYEISSKDETDIAFINSSYKYAGRRFANRLSDLRSFKSPASGRSSGANLYHGDVEVFPPIDPISTASLAFAAAIASSVKGTPVASIEHPPIRISV